MLFDYLKDIVVNKKGNLPLHDYIPFLINRWLSFMSPPVNHLVNQTVNTYSCLDKEQHYKFLTVAFPKLNFLPRLKYIKKIQQQKEEVEHINKLAANREISVREAQTLLELAKQMQ